MREWRPVLFLFVAASCGGVAGWFSAPLLVDDLADLLRPITTACGMTVGMAVGSLIARRVFGGKNS
jgi:hypothetical protein